LSTLFPFHHTWQSAKILDDFLGALGAGLKPVPLPNLRITQPRRHQPRELPVFPNASCLGTDSQATSWRDLSFGWTHSHDSRSISHSRFNDPRFSSMAHVRIVGMSIRRVERLRKTPKPTESGATLIPHPCSHVQHGSCSEQAIRLPNLTRDSRQLQLAQRGRGYSRVETPSSCRPRGSVAFRTSSLSL
jgi:hypothetical protein